MFEPAAALRRKAMAGALGPILPKNNKKNKDQETSHNKSNRTRRTPKGQRQRAATTEGEEKGVQEKHPQQHPPLGEHLQLTPKPVGYASNWDLVLEILGAGLVRWPEPGP